MLVNCIRTQTVTLFQQDFERVGTFTRRPVKLYHNRSRPLALRTCASCVSIAKDLILKPEALLQQVDRKNCLLISMGYALIATLFLKKWDAINAFALFVKYVPHPLKKTSSIVLKKEESIS